jgi:acetyl-CoA carboxylase biotin carboxylase subunit
MLRVAAGEALGYAQDDLRPNGAAIEVRVYAEDPATGFLPSPGRITALSTPSGPFVRDDGGVYSGAEVSSHYDPLVSKLSVWAPTRPLAIERMRRALSEYVVTGIRTNLQFHERLFRQESFVDGHYHTGFIDEHKAELLQGKESAPDEAALAIALAVAVARKQKRIEPVSEGSTGVSPWLAQHRTRQLR